MKFKVLKLSFFPDQLEAELNRLGPGWSLTQLMPMQEIEPGLTINGQPKFKLYYVGVFASQIDEFEDKL